MLNIAASASVSPLAHIEDSVRGSVIEIGEDVVIDSFVRIKPSGGTGNLSIGAGSVINSGTVLYTGNGIRIGRDVLIAANCTLAPVNHACSERGRPIRTQGFQPSKGGIVIEDDVWIGASTVILDGAILRQGCVIGAASVVRGEVAAYSINAGHPLQTIGWRK